MLPKAACPCSSRGQQTNGRAELDFSFRREKSAMPLLIEDNSMHEWILWRLKVSARTLLLSGPARVGPRRGAEAGCERSDDVNSVTSCGFLHAASSSTPSIFGGVVAQRHSKSAANDAEQVRCKNRQEDGAGGAWLLNVQPDPHFADEGILLSLVNFRWWRRFTLCPPCPLLGSPLLPLPP